MPSLYSSIYFFATIINKNVLAGMTLSLWGNKKPSFVKLDVRAVWYPGSFTAIKLIGVYISV